jgi:hypothetical protein
MGILGPGGGGDHTTSSVATLTNKTIDLGNNTVTGTMAELNTAIQDETVVGRATTDTLTNKTFDANGTGNSISNIDIADLANGTDGELITWDAAGAPAAVAVGTATHVLTSNGAGAAPTFQAAASGGGKVVQVVNVTDGAVATGTTTLPHDDTIPQNTEGDEYITLAVTPTNSSNKLLIECVLEFGSSAAGALTAALFQDSTAGALAVNNASGSANAVYNIKMSHYMTAGTTSSTTFKVRIGNVNAGTTTFNGIASGRRFGGAISSSITITEIEV